MFGSIPHTDQVESVLSIFPKDQIEVGLVPVTNQVGTIPQIFSKGQAQGWILAHLNDQSVEHKYQSR